MIFGFGHWEDFVRDIFREKPTWEKKKDSEFAKCVSFSRNGENNANLFTNRNQIYCITLRTVLWLSFV